jgi:hypothetical protein
MLQGRSRRVRVGEDVLRPLARRAGQAAGVCRDRGPGLGDRDAPPSPGDRLPPRHGTSLDARLPRGSVPLPAEGAEHGFSGRDHDKVLYGGPAPGQRGGFPESHS